MRKPATLAQIYDHSHHSVGTSVNFFITKSHYAFLLVILFRTFKWHVTHYDDFYDNVKYHGLHKNLKTIGMDNKTESS